jgi:DNA-directed RNA polymerase specialized sigma24 family protein
VRGESALLGDASASGQGLAQVVGEAPTPDFAAMVAEQCRNLLAPLDDELRDVALAKMQGYTSEEIAERLGCSLSTVERGLRLIRKIWQTQSHR